MDFDEYQDQAFKTARPLPNKKQSLANFGMGISGEAGEVCDYLKKVVFHNHPLDTEILKDEISDVLWYCASIATIANLSLEEIAKHNIDKLKKRYPNGFSSKDSIKRVDTRQGE